jgi:Silencing defective 2 N-terminal ubiquitin domain
MLRAIGAQIEKTTNREACRDLSGRRLRDINEEKRLKNWIEKKKNEEKEDPDEKFQKKIGKLLAKPKKEFKDAEYDEARSSLLDNISDSVEQGFKKARETETVLSSVGLKRKSSSDEAKKKPVKKVKGALWIDAGISSSSDTDDSDIEEGESSGAGSSSSISKS